MSTYGISFFTSYTDVVHFLKSKSLYQSVVAVGANLLMGILFFSGFLMIVYLCCLLLCVPVSLFVGKEFIQSTVGPLFFYIWGSMLATAILLGCFLGSMHLLYIFFLRRSDFAEAAVPRTFKKRNCTFDVVADFSRDVLEWGDMYFISVVVSVARKDIEHDLYLTNVTEKVDKDKKDLIYSDRYSFQVPFSKLLTDDDIVVEFKEKHKKAHKEMLRAQCCERLKYPGHSSGWYGGSPDYVSPLYRQLVPLGIDS